MERRYRWQAALFDLTRRPVLVGRRQLPDLLALQPGHRVLEVGCGTGWNLPLLKKAQPDMDWIGVECSASMWRRARKRASRHRDAQVFYGDYGHDALHLPNVDRVLMSYSLSMVAEVEPLLQQVHNDLRPGGELVVVDFLSARRRWIAKIMQSSGVHLGPARRERLRSLGEVLAEGETTQYGLWTRYWLRVRV